MDLAANGWIVEAQKPTQNPKIPTPKNTAFARAFSKSSGELLPSACDTSQEPHRNCSERSVQMNFLFWVDFFGWIFLLWDHPGKRVSVCPRTQGRVPFVPKTGLDQVCSGHRLTQYDRVCGFLFLLDTSRESANRPLRLWNASKHTLSFHSLIFLFYQGKTSNSPRISLTAEPTKSLEKKEKIPK